MTQDLAVQAPDTDAGIQQQKTGIVVKFLLGWVASVLILVVVALLTNIEWARPHIEKSVEQSFNRSARLGRLSWHLGLNGLAIDTNRFVLEGRNGEDFIESGRSELGVAFLPLFEKRVIIKHVSFHSPEVWAVQETPDKWNFSDLVTEGPEIHLVQIENGTLHLTSKVKGSTWQKYDLNDIDLKFGLPRKSKETWPLYFDCKVPVTRHGRREESGVRLSVTGNGPYAEWKKRPYTFSLELSNFNPLDFKPLYPKMPNIDGSFSGKLTGSGVLSKGIEATISSTVSQLKLPTAEEGGIAELPEISAAGPLVLRDGSVSWKDCKVKLNEWEIQSNGKLQNIGNKLTYQALIDGELGDLQGLYGRVLSKFFLLACPESLERFASRASVGKGSAKVALQLSGTDDVHELASTIRAEGIPLRDLMDLGVNQYASFLPDLQPDSPVSGEILVGQGHPLAPPPKVLGTRRKQHVAVVAPHGPANLVTVQVKDLAVPFENTVLHLSGHLDSLQKDGDVQFSIKDLDAKGLSKLPKQALDENTLNMLKADRLSGKLDLSGKVQIVGNERKISVQTNFKGVSLKAKSGNSVLQGLNGSLSFDGTKLSLENLHGGISSRGAASGEFVASGFMMPAGDRKISLQVSGKQLNIAKVRELAREAGVSTDSAGLSLDSMDGSLQELQLKVGGSSTKPVLSFKISGPDLVLEHNEPQGKHSFRLTSGSIEHSGGQTTVKDVSVSAGNGGKLIVSALINGPLDKGHLKSLALQTDGVELAEWRPLLGPSVLPADMLKALPPAFRPVKNAPVQGKLYGDLKISENSAGYEADGVFGFQNTGTRVGTRGVPLEKLTGIIAFSPDQVIIQELTGFYGKSSFSLDGRLSDYTQKLNWHGQLKGRFYPEELAGIIRATGTGIDLESEEKDAIALRLSGAGNPSEYKLSFYGKAEPHAGLRLSVGEIQVHQPQELPLSFDGGVKVRTDSPYFIEMDKCIISVGEHELKLAGTLKESGSTTIADMKLNTAAPMPFQLLSTMLQPVKTPSATGLSDLSLLFFGPVEALHVNGAVKLSGVNVPSMDVANLNAKLDLPDLPLKPKPDDKVVPSHLTISSAQVGGLDIRDGQAEIVSSASDTTRVSLKNGEAKIAGGKIKVNGFYEPETARYGGQLNIAKLSVAEFVDDYIKGDGKVSGQADVTLALHGDAGEGWMKSLNGNGKFSVHSGTIGSVGKLQGKLHGANLLQQGLLGFNINNFVQAVFPNKTGTFKAIEGEVGIKNGVIELVDVHYDGNDLRMRAAGAVNLPAGTVDIDVAGDIPRVATSIIPGAVGEMTREMTLQKLLGIVTLKQLEDLPSLPLLGDIAADNPRVFSFAVSAPFDKPEQITKSVEKTFKWLPPKPYASAHPVPGL